jgi:hypothetical protein
MALARAFAEAQIDLDCVRKVRRHVLGRVVADPDDGAEGEVDRSELVRQLRRLERYEHRALARRRRAIFRRWRLAGRNHNEQATP